MEEKAWYKSKTVWVNVLGLIVMVVPLLSDYNILAPEKAGLILGVVNIVLRFVSPKQLT